MIKEIIKIDLKTKQVKCVCEKSKILFERILDLTDDESAKLSNVESALCDAEIENLKKFMGDKMKTDCWCKHLAGFIKTEDKINASF